MVAERNVSRILVIFGIVLQIIVNVAYAFFFIIYLIAVGLVGIFDPSEPLLDPARNLLGALGLAVLAGTIFFFLWIIFLIKPSKMKIGLIVSGILAILICGIIPGYLAFLTSTTPTPDPTAFILFLGAIPGILALIAGILAKETMVA